MAFEQNLDEGAAISEEEPTVLVCWSVAGVKEQRDRGRAKVPPRQELSCMCVYGETHKT